MTIWKLSLHINEAYSTPKQLVVRLHGIHAIIFVPTAV